MKIETIILILLAILVTSCSGPSSVSEEEALFEETGLAGEDFQNLITANELELFNLVNTHRATLGIEELTFSVVAYSYAEEHTGLMVSENTLSHKNFNSRASKIVSKTNASHVAENITKNKTTVTDALEGWLSSPSHKNTIEGNFSHTAISIKENGLGELFYTQIFFKQK